MKFMKKSIGAASICLTAALTLSNNALASDRDYGRHFLHFGYSGHHSQHEKPRYYRHTPRYSKSYSREYYRSPYGHRYGKSYSRRNNCRRY